jgi:hypothetical protein
MNQTADLDSALTFVIGRIAEQAKLSGEPLSDEQLLLLSYLPTAPPANWDPEMPVLTPRNIDLERVCALGKTAYQHDRQANPASRDWEFAFAVFTLASHPMGGLLQVAGLKLLKPRWDRLLLVATALLTLVAVLLYVWKADGALSLSAAMGSVCAVIILAMFLGSRRIEKQRLEEEIERCRLASRFSSTLPVKLSADRRSGS